MKHERKEYIMDDPRERESRHLNWLIYFILALVVGWPILTHRDCGDEDSIPASHP